MKKRIYLLVGALCIIMQLVSSCTNFLEVEEKGNLSEKDIKTSEKKEDTNKEFQDKEVIPFRS